MAAVANPEWAYGSLPCPHCGEWLHAQQDWCLNCGDPARTVIAPAPRWRRPIYALIAVLAVTLGVLAGAFIAVTDDDPWDSRVWGRLTHDFLCQYLYFCMLVKQVD